MDDNGLSKGTPTFVTSSSSTLYAQDLCARKVPPSHSYDYGSACYSWVYLFPWALS